jgi:hypothetical protein
MSAPADTPFTPSELQTHRASALKGIQPTLETVRRFILTIRTGWAAKPKEKTEGKSRVKKKAASEAQEDLGF